MTASLAATPSSAVSASAGGFGAGGTSLAPDPRAPYRLRRALALAVVLGAILIALPRFLTYSPYPKLGVQLNWIPGQDFPHVDKVMGRPAQGVVQKGDAVVAINGVRLESPAHALAVMRKLGTTPGAVQLELLRGNRELHVALLPIQLGAWRRLRLFTFPLVAVIAAPLVAFLLVWRRPDLHAAWVFLWFATLQGVLTIWGLFRFTQFVPDATTRVYLLAYSSLVCFFPASFVHFMLVFPRPRWAPGRRLRSPWYWLVVTAYLVAAGLAIYRIATGSDPIAAFWWFQIIALPIGALLLVSRYASPAHGDWQPRASERTLAILTAVVLVAMAAVGAAAEDPRMTVLYTLPTVRALLTTLTLAWLCTPLVIALLIANDPAFDPRRLIVRSLPYALLSFMLAALYLGVVLGAQRLFAATTGEEAMAFNVGAALIVAFMFSPLRERTQRALDRLYGRDPRAVRAALDHAGHELLGALGRDEVRTSVERGLAQGLRRPVTVEWPSPGMPRLAADEEVPADAHGAVANLLQQAGTRLENLSLQEHRAAAERREAELREAAARAELQALHAQVQPHFLFNALNVLSYLTETDPPAAQRFTERLADMLRYTIEAGRRPAAPLSEEIAFVEDYLGVARERYEGDLSFEYRGAEDLLSVAVPPLLLQPLVENSLKHGLTPGAGGLHLSLDAREENGIVTLEFSDDGRANGGRPPGLGVGLRNLEQRVCRFGGREASMRAAARPDGGFTVTLCWHTTGEIKG
ncbi:MAG: histidine kinase [Candidatus Eisenbacteria bacterium]|nr:histidine kinase [Candidatus Eisenbacteria bacterium]